MLACDYSRCLVQVPGSAIIAQAFPSSKYLLLIRIGQIREIWKGSQKSFKVWNDSRHLRLLQHDLADPDPVRISVLAPGEGALVHAKPAQQVSTNSPGLFGSRWIR